MNARLYVGNLPEDASMEALRRRFAQHGAVADVHMAVDRSSGRSRGYAFVTMANGEDARAAMNRLDGAMFEHRPLRVNEAGADAEEHRHSRAAPTRPRVRITSQFRERQNMTYELDCEGLTLAIRVFPVDRTEQAWRIEASANDATGAPAQVTSEACATRARALEEVATAWSGRGALQQAIAWPEVAEAMAAVRAI